MQLGNGTPVGQFDSLRSLRGTAEAATTEGGVASSDGRGAAPGPECRMGKTEAKPLGPNAEWEKQCTA